MIFISTPIILKTPMKLKIIPKTLSLAYIQHVFKDPNETQIIPKTLYLAYIQHFLHALSFQKWKS